MTPWLHRPQKRSLPSPIYLMLILSLTLMPGPTPAAQAAPPTAAHPAPPTAPPHVGSQIKSPPIILTPSLVILSEAKNLHPPQPMPTPKTKPALADLEGTWEIQEEERTYVATLDVHGNGPYTHEGGTFTTTTLEGRRWSGKWSQTGNDREGEFEVLLSEDGLTAEGRWWYTRVGTFTHIPARVYGGTYLFKRQSPKTDSSGQPP